MTNNQKNNDKIDQHQKWSWTGGEHRSRQEEVHWGHIGCLMVAQSFECPEVLKAERSQLKALGLGWKNQSGNQIEGTELRESRDLTAPSNLRIWGCVIFSYQLWVGFDVSFCCLRWVPLVIHSHSIKLRKSSRLDFKDINVCLMTLGRPTA